MKKEYYKYFFILVILLGLVTFLAAFNQGEEKKKVSVKETPSVSELPEVTVPYEEPLTKDLQNILSGTWKVKKLIGFTEIQNDYTNDPDGHDIIGDQIEIGEKEFSSMGIKKYTRYQGVTKQPVYQLITDKEDWSYAVKYLEKDTEIFDMMMNGYLQRIEIEDEFQTPAAVGLEISDKNKLILVLDGAYYLLDKVPSALDAFCSDE